MSAGLSIGEFSRITHLSIKALRRYHEAGLLVPARVDPDSAYRYYDLDQVPTAQVIHRFRELGMPVKEVRELVAVSDPDVRAAVIAQHLRRLEAQLDETHAAVVSLRRLLEPDPRSARGARLPRRGHSGRRCARRRRPRRLSHLVRGRDDRAG